MNEVRVNSWNELHDILFKDWLNKKIGRYRAPHAFRGLSDSSYKLKTTLMRLSGPYTKLESHLLVNFRRYSGLETVKFDSLWYWMSLGQHHGLPTRLLDWTYSPLVAMHFATANIQKFHIDGVIWVVDFSKTQEFLPDKLKVASEKIRSPVFPIETLDDVITGDTQSLNNVIEALNKLKSMSKSKFVVFMEPPSIDDRIQNQFALFSFMSDETLSLDDWLKKQDAPDLWRKIIIPASLKGEIRDKLDQSNISERILFPGLDSVSKWLARHYSTINKKPKA
ncbi:MAG: FRG domain-containing protein [Candidatus Helarchaeota archaeon]|nr:FRG domain-containing protein [Candidatus Helarchaeota archaeon]